MTGGGAESFLYGNGQTTQINPTGGLAMSINNSGQVVGGPYSSINGSGQYVGSAISGVNNNDSVRLYLPEGRRRALLSRRTRSITRGRSPATSPLRPDGADIHPVIYQGGQVTDLFSKVGVGDLYEVRWRSIRRATC